MHLPLRFALISLLTLASNACATVSGDDAAVRGAALVSALHASGDFGGAVIVSREGRIVYEGAFGTADGTAPFTPDTTADGASLAKPVTAAAIWLLAQEGALELDAPVQRYVEEFPYAGVSLRHLLSHTAGLADYGAFEPLLSSGRPISTSDLLREQKRLFTQPAFAAGTAFEYCNLCYDTLALVIERVSGQSYQDFIRRRLLGPAGARGAFVRPARFADWRGVRTLGFRSSRADAAVFDVLDNEGFYGGSNIYFSARDLAAWAGAWAQNRVLPRDIEADALAPARIGAQDSALTLTSWYCSPDRTRCHYSGHHQAFFNLVYWDAGRKISVVYVSNTTLPPPLHAWFARALIALAEGRAPEPRPNMTGSAEQQVDIAVAAGRYHGAGIGDLEISTHDGAAFVHLSEGPRAQLHPVGFGMMYAPAFDAYLGFSVAADGAITGLRWESLTGAYEAARR
jgi:CubicO group peptidase (beta-lactamase class C family)